MKKIENSFAVTGFVGKDAEIRQFTTASVARFSMAISRTEKAGEDTTRVSAFLNVETWRKNEKASFELLKKGQMVTCRGFFKPEVWSDKDGIQLNLSLFYLIFKSYANWCSTDYRMVGTENKVKNIDNKFKLLGSHSLAQFFEYAL